MQSASPLSCPNCGGPTDGAALSCGYCRAPLATVRCGRCFHLNPPYNAHCGGCGAELGLEPIGAPSSLTCPHCRVPLEGFRGDTGTLCDCSSCGGQFVEHALLSDLLDRRQILGTSVPRVVTRTSRPVETVRYIPCPVCAALMNRENFGRRSGIVVDVCSEHGIWFDRGELPGVLEFVQNGAVARARYRAPSSHTPVSTRHELAGSRPSEAHGPASRPSLLDDLGEAGVALAAFVRDLIRKT